MTVTIINNPHKSIKRARDALQLAITRTEMVLAMKKCDDGIIEILEQQVKLDRAALVELDAWLPKGPYSR